tara:strand:- start:29 stop:418 length:390 start_codon:yes stop_codon:yes gene_type:complete
MASILRVNTITDASSNNSTAVSVINQGTAKVWNCFDPDAVLRDSHNTASITDNGTAHFDINLTSNFANDDFAFNGTCGVATDGGSSTQIVGGTSSTAKDTGQYGIRNQNYGGTFNDKQDMMTSAHGDLA